MICKSALLQLSGGLGQWPISVPAGMRLATFVLGLAGSPNAFATRATCNLTISSSTTDLSLLTQFNESTTEFGRIEFQANATTTFPASVVQQFYLPVPVRVAGFLYFNAQEGGGNTFRFWTNVYLVL